MTIDVEKLREDLIIYFGSASLYYKNAIMDVMRIKQADDNEVVRIALENHFNLNDYEIASQRSR